MQASKLQNNLALKITIAAAISFGWSACQKGELDELREAQYCLNKAGTGQAAACVTGLRSKSSQEASKLVCASIYIDDGFGSPAQIADAIDRISNGGSGCTTTCSGTLNAMTTLKFSGTADVARAKSNDAVSFCTRSGVVAYSNMSAIFSIGTLMAIAIPTLDENSNAGSITAAINAVDNTDLGNIVSQTYAASCSDTENIAESNQQFCAEMGLAINSTNGSAAAVGACLKYKLANPSATSCSP